MIFSVTILGSGSALPTSKRLPSAHVLNAHERLFLIDCAEGTQMQLRKLKLRLSKIGHIFISHLHGDHTLGLFGLLSTYNLLGRESELHIYAHKELEPILWTNVDFFVEKLRYKLVFHALNPREKECVYENDKLYVESIPLRHRIPACGFIFREKECGLNIRKELIEKYELGLADIASIKYGADMVTPSGELIPNSELICKITPLEDSSETLVSLYIKKDNIEINIDNESAGIKKLISIAAALIYCMQDENALIVIDELDAHIFEYLLAEILKNMSEIAKGQLVFTAHNLSVMEVLDSNSIIITSIKDGDVSYNYFKKVSKTANLRQRYLRSQFMWSEDNINPLELNSSSLRASMRNLVESDKYYSIYKRN